MIDLLIKRKSMKKSFTNLLILQDLMCQARTFLPKKEIGYGAQKARVQRHDRQGLGL